MIVILIPYILTQEVTVMTVVTHRNNIILVKDNGEHRQWINFTRE